MYNREYREAVLNQKKEDLRSKASHFLNEHPKLVMACKAALLVCAYLAVTTLMPSAIFTHIGATRFVDDKTGVIWRVKRPLTTEQALVFEQRVLNGEPMGAILDSLGVLKH